MKSNQSTRNAGWPKRIIQMYVFMIVMLVFTVVSRILYAVLRVDAFLSIYVTFLTVFYHFSMRILVGECVTLFFRNREFHYNAGWYQQHRWEEKLYHILQVKHWKGKVITAKPEQFDMKQRTYQELLHNMTQAEIVHEIIMILSFVPLLGIVPYGAPAVFIMTSIAACLIDGMFVIIQRYNRPRVLKLKERMANRTIRIYEETK